MNTAIKVSLFSLMLCLITIGCAGTMPDSNQLVITVKTLKLAAWINMMPGGKPSFHLSGEIEIKNTGDEIVSTLNLDQIAIYNNTTDVYKFKPVFNNKKEAADNDILPKAQKDYFIASPDKINTDKFKNLDSIKLLLSFSSGGKRFEFETDNIKIQRVY
jgi:hypothetical protein